MSSFPIVNMGAGPSTSNAPEPPKIDPALAKENQEFFKGMVKPGETDEANPISEAAAQLLEQVFSQKIDVTEAMKRLDYLKRPGNTKIGEIPDINDWIFALLNKHAQHREKLYQGLAQTQAKVTFGLLRVLDKVLPSDYGSATTEQKELVGLLVRFSVLRFCKSSLISN